MHTVSIVTFKGCQSTMDFRDLVERLIDQRTIDARVSMTVAPSTERAAELGLHGSPTILLDGREYQGGRRGPAGFY